MFKILSSIIGVVGFLLVLGVAGADCDGKCMENSMPIGDIIMYSLLGFALMIGGLLGALRD